MVLLSELVEPAVKLRRP